MSVTSKQWCWSEKKLAGRPELTTRNRVGLLLQLETQLVVARKKLKLQKTKTEGTFTRVRRPHN